MTHSPESCDYGSILSIDIQTYIVSFPGPMAVRGRPGSPVAVVRVIR